MLKQLYTYLQSVRSQRVVVGNVKGQGLVEYALILALVSVVSVGVLSTMGNEVSYALEKTTCSLDSGEDCQCRVIEEVVVSEFSCAAGDLFAYTAVTTCGTDTELSLLSESSSSSNEYAMSYNSSTSMFEMTDNMSLCSELASASPPQLYLVSRHTKDDNIRSFQLGDNGAPVSGYGSGGSSESSSSGSGSSGSGSSGSGDSGSGSSGSGSSGSGDSGSGSSGSGSSGSGDSGSGSSGSGSSGSGDSGSGSSGSGSSGSGDSGSGSSGSGSSGSGDSGSGTSGSGSSGSGDSDNNAPVMDTVENQAIAEGETLTVSFSATDADDDTLIYSEVGDLPAFMSFTATGTPTLTIEPGYSDAGTYSVMIGVIDNNGGSDSVTFDVVVSNQNQTPELAAIGDQSVNESETKTVTLSATDADGDDLTFGLSGTLPGFVTFNNSSATPTITVAPSFDDAGTYSITAYVTDTSGESATETFSLIVNDANRAPVLATVPDETVDEGGNATINLSATDADGNDVTLSASNTSAFMTFTPGTSSATLEIDPGEEDSGTYMVTINADDGNGGTDSITITIVVNDTITSKVVSFIIANAGSPNSSDSAIKSRLESDGYTVNLFSQNSSSSSVTAASPKLILISESVNSGSVGSKYRNTAIPVVVMEPYLYDDMKMANTFGTDSNEQKIKITNESHSLAAGISNGNRKVTNSNRTQGYGDPSNNNAIIVATLDSNTGRATIFAYDTNTTMEDGVSAPARRIGFFAYKDSAEVFHNRGWKLFDAAIEWAVGG